MTTEELPSVRHAGTIERLRARLDPTQPPRRTLGSPYGDG